MSVIPAAVERSRAVCGAQASPIVESLRPIGAFAQASEAQEWAPAAGRGSW